MIVINLRGDIKRAVPKIHFDTARPLLTVCLFQQRFRIEIVFLDILEIVVRSDLDFGTCGLVAYDDTLRMHLQGRDCPHLVHTALDGLLQGARFIMTIGEDNDLFRVHNRSDADGERRFRYFIHIVVEETRIGDDRIGCQRFDACARCQR